MAWRTNESPMEFEYENGVGKVDHSSPFAKLAGQKSPALNHNFGTTFKSPSPTRNPTFNVPPLPQTPKPASTTFRDRIDTDFSSAAESSPDNGNGADCEDTPSPKRMANVTVFRGSPHAKANTPPAKRQSWLQKLKSRQGSMDLMKRSHKRKRRAVELEDHQITLRRTHGDSDYNDSSRPSSADGPGASSPRKSPRSAANKVCDMGTIPAILSFIHEHPHLPTILAFWGQMVFSLFVLAIIGWTIWIIWGAVATQIELEAEKLGMDVLLDVRACEKDFIANRCDATDPASIPPALQSMCDAWDHCRRQDWRAQGRARIGASTFAGILNSFVDELSWKFIGCCLAFAALLLVGPHQLFGQVRRANEVHLQQTQGAPPQEQQNFFPQTPSRQVQREWAANGGPFNTGFYTPQTGARAPWEAGRAGGAGTTDWGSPSKRLEGRGRSPAKQLEYKKFS